MKLFHRVCKTNNFNLIQLHFHGYPALYNPLETHCDEFTWYRGGLTKNFLPFLQAENKRNTGNCDGISTRYCCEMEEMLNLVFFLLFVVFETQVSDSLMNFPTYLNCKNKDLSVILPCASHCPFRLSPWILIVLSDNKLLKRLFANTVFIRR